LDVIVIDRWGPHIAAMNEYEKQREENIRKNNQLLAQLGLDTLEHALETQNAATPGPVRPRVLNNASGRFDSRMTLYFTRVVRLSW
jgi:hypothetical protein